MKYCCIAIEDVKADNGKIMQLVALVKPEFYNSGKPYKKMPIIAINNSHKKIECGKIYDMKIYFINGNFSNLYEVADKGANDYALG